MDPNQTTQQPTPIQSAPNPVNSGQTPQVIQPAPPQPTKPSSSHKIFLIVLVAIVLVLLGLAAFYFYTQMQSNQYAASTIKPLDTIPSPTEQAASQEMQDTLNINVGSIEGDLKDLNQDLKQL